MRSEKINPLFSPISTLQGVGPKIEILLSRLVGKKLINLLWHLPYNVIKRNYHENLNEAKINSIVTIKVKVIDHNPSRFKRQPYKVSCICEQIPINIIFFNSRHPIIKNSLPINSEKYISGKLEYFKNVYQITHPSYVVDLENFDQLKEIEPIYALTAGLSQKFIQKKIQNILKIIPNLNEWIDLKTLNKYSFTS